MNLKSANKKKIQGATAALLIGMALIVTTYAIGVNGTTAYTAEEQLPVRPSPPPAPMQMWGEEVSAEQGKKQLGFDRLSEPTNMPEGIILKVTRAIVSEDGTYRQLSQFYGPESIDSSNTAYINDFLRNGGILIVYVEDDRAKPFNWKDLVPQLVNESPEKREMTTINEADALIVKGDKERKEKSEIMFDLGGTRIAIVSNSYSAEELLPTAQSIRE